VPTTHSVDLASLVILVVKAVQDGPETLREEELLSISVCEDELVLLLRDLSFYGMNSCRQELRRRDRTKKFADRPTDELLARYRVIRDAHVAAIVDDVNDEAGDSLYEAPAIDSEESILHDLLKERGAI
jgi:hypothetical protein